MAKRKRLSPTISNYQPDPDVAVSKPAMRAPIADVAAEASAVAALDALSNSMQTARATGRMVIEVPLAQIDTGFLVRDRLGVDSEEMQVLMASLTERGQQTPIEVIDLKGNHFGLISGWRRCEALKRLHAQTEDARFSTVLALVRQPADQADSYLAMVEENEIRVGLSYYERARIAVKATAQGAFETEKQALNKLYSSASRTKRSKIKSFVTLYHALDDVLDHPEAIGERLGLQIAQLVQQGTQSTVALVEAVKRASATTAEQEQAVLSKTLNYILEPNKKPVKERTARQNRAKGSDAKFQIRKLHGGVVAHLYASGRIEIEGKKLSADLHGPLLAWLDRALK